VFLSHTFSGRHGRDRGHHKLHAIFGRGFGHGGFGGRHGRGEGGGRRRLFDKDELKLVLLKLIEEQPRHGYDLIREIEDRSGGAYAPSPGVIYPTLTLLADMGLIVEAASEGARKQFEITHTGVVHLTERTVAVEAAMAKLAAMSARRERTDGAPVRRAMGNLREVLQTRLSRDDATIETLHDVAAILDDAAQRIERL
jgi:DNA-binding PadR family transcriptional regulator